MSVANIIDVEFADSDQLRGCLVLTEHGNDPDAGREAGAKTQSDRHGAGKESARTGRLGPG
jgi:hypothetical protein